MGVFSPVIEAFVLPVLDPGHDLPLGSGIALQLVGDQGLRMKDAGEDLLHVSVIPCGHFATPLEAGL
jgi:hypothetical protein